MMMATRCRQAMVADIASDRTDKVTTPRLIFTRPSENLFPVPYGTLQSSARSPEGAIFTSRGSKRATTSTRSA